MFCEAKATCLYKSVDGKHFFGFLLIPINSQTLPNVNVFRKAMQTKFLFWKVSN